MISADVARKYHDGTKHSHGSLSDGGHVLDWANQPHPFKGYPGVGTLPLPNNLSQGRLTAVEALSGARPGAPAKLGLPAVARLLSFRPGSPGRGGRAGAPPARRPSAGALYPNEVYAVCGDLDELEASVYHFGPLEFALRRLRAGDHRAGARARGRRPGAGVGGSPRARARGRLG